jgi:hypothetical protein
MLSVSHNQRRNLYLIQAPHCRSLSFVFNSYVDAKGFIDGYHAEPAAAILLYRCRHGGIIVKNYAPSIFKKGIKQ